MRRRVPRDQCVVAWTGVIKYSFLKKNILKTQGTPIYKVFKCRAILETQLLFY